VIQPIVKSSLSRDLTLTMIDLIRSGEWQPGQKIPGENELAHAFGVSRNIMRESLKSLAMLDILISRHGSGTYVSDNAMAGIAGWQLYHQLGGDADVRTRMETRLIIEPALAGLAAQRATGEDIGRIRSLLDVYAPGEPVTEVKGRAFHIAIARASQNELLAGLIETLLSQLYDDRYLKSTRTLTPKEIEAQYADHARIAGWIADRDPAGASREMEKHLKKRLSLLSRF